MSAPLASSYTCPVTVGRKPQLTLIRDRLHHAAPGVILVTGEAGVGKSRLVSDAATEATRLGYRVIQGHCFEADAGLPFAPLRDLLRSLSSDHPPEELARLTGPYAKTLAWLLPELGSISHDAAVFPPLHDKRSLFDALDRLLAALAAVSPVLILVEDLHWSDATSLEFLLFLARRSLARPLGLLITHRSEEVQADMAHFLAGLDRERLAVEVRLKGLGPSEVDAMLRAIFGLTRPAPAALIHLLSSLTEGNPFFIEEVLKSLTTAGAELGVDRVGTVPHTDDLQIPRTVQDAVRRRSMRLTAAAKRVLELAAVVGVRFDVALVQELVALNETALLAALKELVSAQLIVEESAERFAFRHALTRQAVYAELLTRERQELHRTVADRLERSPAAAGDASLSDLAYHFFAAAAWAKALEYSQRAGDHAMGLYAPHAAIGHYTRAIEATRRLSLPPDPTLVRARGSAHEMLGEFDRALADYEAARDLARRTAERAVEVEALLSLGLLWAARDYARAGEATREALVVAQEVGKDALVARCLNRLGNWHLNSERPLEAQRCHREALTIVEELGDRRGVAETLDLLGLAAFLGGDLVQGTARLHSAVDVWREVGDRRGLASSLILLGARGSTYHTDTVLAAATYAEAQAEAEEGLAIAREIDWRAGEAWGLWTVYGQILAPQGAYAHALPGMHAALAIAEEIEHRQWMAATHCMLGHTYADLLAYPQAREHLERALVLARETGSPYWTRTAAGFLASTAVAEGVLADADTVLGDALGPEVTMDTLAQRLLWRAAAELALARDDPERALRIADRLVASAPHASADRPIARLEKLRGEALLVLDRTEEAETALRRARDTAAALGTRTILWRSHVALGRLYRAQGRDEEAAHAYDAARGIVDELASEVPDDVLRADFLAAATVLFPPALGRSVRRTTGATPGGLTVREREVTRLLTRGLSNREIAETLFIADWTAATHVRNILAKLGFNSRTQIAAWAVEQGLADQE